MYLTAILATVAAMVGVWIGDMRLTGMGLTLALIAIAQAINEHGNA